MYQQIEEYLDAYITMELLTDKKSKPQKEYNNRRLQLLRNTDDIDVDKVLVNVLLNTYSNEKSITFHIKPSLNKTLVDLLKKRSDIFYLNETDYNYVSARFIFTNYDEFVDIMNSTLMKADIQW